MELPPNFVIENTLQVGVVYKLAAPELIETDKPHYFVVVATDDMDNYLVVCTSQLENKLRYLKRAGLDERTLAYLAPNDVNGLTKDTYLNCNEYFIVSRQKLVRKLTEGHLDFTGNVSSDEYEEIKYSIIESPINDIPEEVLIYPEKE